MFRIHLHIEPKSRMSGDIQRLPLYAVMPLTGKTVRLLSTTKLVS